MMLTLSLFGQTADDFVSQGRTNLALPDIVAANRCFSNAVALAPNHPAANVFYAATRLLTLPYKPSGSNFLDRLGVPCTGRDIYNWTSLPTMDTNHVPCPPPGLNAAEFTAEGRTNVLYEVLGAEANLAKVTNTNFLLTLTSNETHIAAVTLDYGDLQMARAWLRGLEYLCYTAYAWDLNAPLRPLHALYYLDQLTLERLLKDHPSLLRFATTNELVLARQAFVNGVDRYLASSQFIRSRATNVICLFNFDPQDAPDEQEFRFTLEDLKASLNGVVTLRIDTNYSVFLGAHFGGRTPPRALLPAFRGNGFGLHTLPDPTFGGLVYGVDPDELDQQLADSFDPIPTLGQLWRSGNQLHLSAFLYHGNGYAVERSTDLVNWETVAILAAWTNRLDLIESMSLQPRRFYRVVDRSDSMPVPANDRFADAQVLTGYPAEAFGYTANSTGEPGEPSVPWGSTWWRWTAPVSRTVVVVSEGITEHPPVFIYTGTTLTNLSLVSQYGAPFNAVAGTTYWIQVGRGWQAAGAVRLAITSPPQLTVNSPLEGTVFVAPANIPISASAFDLDGRCTLRVTGDWRELGRTTNTSINLTWTNVGAGQHWVQINAVDDLGAITHAYRQVRVAPPNDLFTTRTPLSGNLVTINGTCLGASMEPGEPDHAWLSGTNGTSVWYGWTAPFTGMATINVNGQAGKQRFDPILAVYTNTTLANLQEVASTAGDYGEPAQLSIMVRAGTTYQVAVAGQLYSQGGEFTLRIAQNMPPEVSLAPPLPNPNYHIPAIFTISANAYDPDGVIRLVAFYDVYSLFHPPFMGQPRLLGVVTNPPFSLTLSNLPAGSYELAAKAVDNLEAVGYSDSTTVSILHPYIQIGLGSGVYNASGAAGSRNYYRVTVPPGISSMTIRTQGGSGDCDLYVAYERQPTFGDYDYRPYLHGNFESVTVLNPAAGDWHIMLHGYLGYGGVMLQAGVP